ncbi:MAG: hypothetical protein J0H62_06720 [Rhizobiales bacterium]|nr:hypothetical protein [Hyphomicrobiales bacterium]
MPSRFCLRHSVVGPIGLDGIDRNPAANAVAAAIAALRDAAPGEPRLRASAERIRQVR